MRGWHPGDNRGKGGDAMLTRLIGPSTSAAELKESLDASVERVRITAHRVANATTAQPGTFEATLSGLEREANAPVELEAEMVALADEHLRFDAAARLLQKVYAQVRASVRER